MHATRPQKKPSQPSMKMKMPRNEPARGKAHSDVMAMVRDLAADPEFVDELIGHMNARQLVKMLAVLRGRAGLTQHDLARRAGCKQPRISKLENSVDVDVSIGDIVAYLEATGHKATLFFVPAGSTPTDEAKMHTLIIEALLARAALPQPSEKAPRLLRVEAPRIEKEQLKPSPVRIRAGTAFGAVPRLEGA